MIHILAHGYHGTQRLITLPTVAAVARFLSLTPFQVNALHNSYRPVKTKKGNVTIHTDKVGVAYFIYRQRDARTEAEEWEGYKCGEVDGKPFTSILTEQTIHKMPDGAKLVKRVEGLLIRRKGGKLFSVLEYPHTPPKWGRKRATHNG